MTRDDLLELGRGLAEDTREFVRAETSKLRDEILDSLSVEHDGERGFTFRCGDRTLGRFVIPTMIHRGVWSAGQRYEYQDVTTWGGSQWVCMASRASSKPGEADSGWVLAVKKGDPGRGAR